MMPGANSEDGFCAWSATRWSRGGQRICPPYGMLPNQAQCSSWICTFVPDEDRPRPYH